MSEWKTVRLGDYITEYSVKNKSNEDIPVYSVTNTQGFCTEYFSKDVSSKDKSNYKIVPRGCFAYNPSRINVGSVDWQRYEDRVIVSPLYNVFKVSPELENQYLYYFLKSDIGHTLITSKAEGSVRDNLKITMLAEFSIPLPPLEEQKHIAAMLDKCTALVTKYKLMLEKYDTLIKSRFIEMFGDPVQNPMGWEEVRITELCKNPDDIKCGPFGTQLSKDEYQKKGVPIFGIPQINSSFRVLPTDFLTNSKAEKLDAYSLIYGDIAMSRKGNVGKCAIYSGKEKGIIHSDVVRLRVDDAICNSIYLMNQLHINQKVETQISNVSSGAIMAGINVTKMKDIIVYNPPLSLQNNFAAFVRQIDKSKFAVQKSLEKTETLYKSLMQRYFA